MKSKFNSHLHRILLLLLLSAAAAQPPPPENENQYPNYAKFSPSMAIIIVVLIAALFFMGFFSIYIRHCSDSAAGGSAAGLRRALSLRGRRGGAASRGLDAAVIDTFPTFTYAEVKDHKIGKSALECAVCLNEFEDHETLRLIPKCDHVFHPECVDVWLESHVTCPVCRANLTEAETGPAQLPEPAPVQFPVEIERIERNHSRTGEIAVQIDVEANSPVAGYEFPTRPPRSFSVRTTKITGPDKFRSHSTGHSLIQPGENLDRFTLKLPNMVRKEMMDRAVLNRTGSAAATLPRERSSRRGLRTGGESSSRWGFFSRGMSMRATKVVAEAGESSGSAGNGPPPMKMPSFKCLEPKTDDETGLMAEDRNKSSV